MSTRKNSECRAKNRQGKLFNEKPAFATPPTDGWRSTPRRPAVPTTTETPKKELHQCAHCPQTFSTPRGCKIHEKQHGGTGKLECASCDYRCNDCRSLIIHGQVHAFAAHEPSGSLVEAVGDGVSTSGAVPPPPPIGALPYLAAPFRLLTYAGTPRKRTPPKNRHVRNTTDGSGTTQAETAAEGQPMPFGSITLFGVGETTEMAQLRKESKYTQQVEEMAALRREQTHQQRQRNQQPSTGFTLLPLQCAGASSPPASNERIDSSVGSVNSQQQSQHGSGGVAVQPKAPQFASQIPHDTLSRIYPIPPTPMRPPQNMLFLPSQTDATQEQNEANANKAKLMRELHDHHSHRRKWLAELCHQSPSSFLDFDLQQQLNSLSTGPAVEQQRQKNECSAKLVLQGKLQDVIVRELQGTNLNVNETVNNLLSRDDDETEVGEAYLREELLSLFDDVLRLDDQKGKDGGKDGDNNGRTMQKHFALSDTLGYCGNKTKTRKAGSEQMCERIGRLRLQQNDLLLTTIHKPGDQEELPEQFTRADFWAVLRRDERIRTGVEGEWVKGHNERLTIDGLLCLSDGQWLNADIIDCYLDRICRRFPTRAQFIPTYAMLSYERMGTVPSEWYWQLAETDVVLAPAHLNNNHWAMAVLNIRERTLQLMDSMNKGGTNAKEKQLFMKKIMNIIHDVAALQRVEIGDRSAWNMRERLSVPQQENGIDCGIFALIFALYSLERRELNFSQCHIPFFRRRICHDILFGLEFDNSEKSEEEEQSITMSNLDSSKFEQLDWTKWWKSSECWTFIARRNPKDESQLHRISLFGDPSAHPFPPLPSDSWESEMGAFLHLCEQKEVFSWGQFQDLTKTSPFGEWSKIGEGTFGEVYTALVDNVYVALKVIPFAANEEQCLKIVNDDHLKPATLLFNELLITKELSKLADDTGLATFSTPSFVRLNMARVVRGCFPPKLLEAWDVFKKAKPKLALNERPDKYADESQHFVIIALSFGGVDLESYNLRNCRECYSIFYQISLSLAIAEAALEFEHRDLHAGNILINRCPSDRKIGYLFDGQRIEVRSNGVEVSIIDFSISRMKKKGVGVEVFVDLSEDAALFSQPGVSQNGDYQYDVYRKMRAEVGNKWDVFAPKNNVFWLDYVAKRVFGNRRLIKAKRRNEIDNLFYNFEQWDKIHNFLNTDTFKSVFRDFISK